MRQPIKRYDIDSDGVPCPLNTGDYVRHSDYAALAAENERLIELGNNQMAEKFELKAEVERLRKAGDAMYAAAVQDSTGLWVLKPFQDWKAAKEGGAK